MKGKFFVITFLALCFISISCSNKKAVVLSENKNNIGDIIFTDGTKCSAREYAFAKGDRIPCAIIFHVSADDKPKAVGLKKSGPLKWSYVETEKTDGKKKFVEIQGTRISGDILGGDNWEEICKEDPAGSSCFVADGLTVCPAEVNYPAFYWCTKYAELNNFEGKLAEGWYIPSVKELDELYMASAKVEESITRINETELGTADALCTSCYWSSTQYSIYEDFAWDLNFTNGIVNFYYKGFENSVRPVKSF